MHRAHACRIHNLSRSAAADRNHHFRRCLAFARGTHARPCVARDREDVRARATGARAMRGGRDVCEGVRCEQGCSAVEIEAGARRR